MISSLGLICVVSVSAGQTCAMSVSRRSSTCRPDQRYVTFGSCPLFFNPPAMTFMVRLCYTPSNRAYLWHVIANTHRLSPFVGPVDVGPVYREIADAERGFDDEELRRIQGLNYLRGFQRGGVGCQGAQITTKDSSLAFLTVAKGSCLLSRVTNRALCSTASAMR